MAALKPQPFELNVTCAIKICRIDPKICLEFSSQIEIGKCKLSNNGKVISLHQISRKLIPSKASNP